MTNNRNNTNRNTNKMIKTSIESLEALLSEARKNGCARLKLQLYDSWEEMAKEQQQPSHPPEEYKLDMRFYNTIEFETQIQDMQATDKLITRIEGDTLIIRVALSDRDTLMKSLGIDED